MSGMEVVIPMMIGGGLGAALDKSNPLRGAALGAVGGYAAAPLVAGATGAAGAAGAAGASQGAAGLYGATLAPAGVGAQQAAMLAAQTEGMTGGLAHTIGSFGASAQPGLASLGSGGLANSAAKFGLQAMMQGQQRPQAPMAAPPPAVGMGGGQPATFASLSPYARRRGILG